MQVLDREDVGGLKGLGGNDVYSAFLDGTGGETMYVPFDESGRGSSGGHSVCKISGRRHEVGEWQYNGIGTLWKRVGWCIPCPRSYRLGSPFHCLQSYTGGTRTPRLFGHGSSRIRVISSNAWASGQYDPDMVYTSPMVREAITLFSRLHTTLLRHDPLLSELASWIPWMTLPFRKVLVTSCQMGMTHVEYEPIARSFKTLYNTSDWPARDGKSLQRHELDLMIKTIPHSSINRSLILLLLRAESSLLPDDGSEQALLEGLWKEVQSGMNVYRQTQQNDYRSLWGQRQRWCPEYPITPRWIKYAEDFAWKFCQALEGKTLFPQVQRKKNMSNDSARLLHVSGYRRSDRHWKDYGTVDLEIYNYQEGIRVGGGLEMRRAWKYNDLKPRVYYCTGGDCYWESRYMKPVAVAAMEASAYTKVARRTDPTLVSYNINGDQWMCLWDLYSFTTTLSELRYFLYWVARYAESNLRCRQNPLRLFDWREGFIEKPVWELIDEYNEAVNVYAGVSLHRVVDMMGLDEEDADVQHTLVNSGALGVHGNIGFSTTYGLQAAATDGVQGTGVSVGDDAFKFEDGDPRIKLIPGVRRIGILHEEKADILEPIEDPTETEFTKFVKRRLTRGEHTIDLDYIFNFPILPIIFNINHPNRTVSPPEDPEERIMKTVTMIGKMLWDMNLRSDLLGGHDISLFREVQDLCYRQYKLPRRGCLPGRLQFQEGRYFGGAIPPLIGSDDFDPRYEDWAEFLWKRHENDGYIMMPMISEVQIHPDFEFETEELRITKTPYSMVLEDLGIIEEVRKWKEVVPVIEGNRRRFLQWISGKGLEVYSYRLVGVLPVYHHGVISHLRRNEQSLGWEVDIQNVVARFM